MIPALLATVGLPLLVKAVGGALSGVDHPAARAATEALDAVGQAIGNKQIPPEQLAEANRHIERLAEIDGANARALLDDGKDARALTASLAATQSATAWSSPVLSAIIVAGFFGMLYVVMTVPLPEASREVATILLGTLAAGFSQVANFWLGSSKGSLDKTEMLKGVVGRK